MIELQQKCTQWGWFTYSANGVAPELSKWTEALLTSNPIMCKHTCCFFYLFACNWVFSVKWGFNSFTKLWSSWYCKMHSKFSFSKSPLCVLLQCLSITFRKNTVGREWEKITENHSFPQSTKSWRRVGKNKWGWNSSLN